MVKRLLSWLGFAQYWTQEEIDDIQRRARERALEIQKYVE